MVAKAIGDEVVRLARNEVDGWRLPLHGAAAVTPGTRMIFLTNPNNPTGDLLRAADVAEIVAIASRVVAWLLVGEVYAGLEMTEKLLFSHPDLIGLYVSSGGIRGTFAAMRSHGKAGRSWSSDST